MSYIEMVTKNSFWQVNVTKQQFCISCLKKEKSYLAWYHPTISQCRLT